MASNRSEKRKDKMQIFKTFMTSRIYGWTPDSVNALNIIDIVYSDDKKVRAAWKDLNDKFRVTNPDQQHLKKIEGLKQSERKMKCSVHQLSFAPHTQARTAYWEFAENTEIKSCLHISISVRKSK